MAGCTVDGFEREASGQSVLNVRQGGHVRRVRYAAEALVLDALAQTQALPNRLDASTDL